MLGDRAWREEHAERPRPFAAGPADAAPDKRKREPVGARAYVLREARGDRDITLLATGSEVEIAVAVAERLQAEEGIAAAVVSMPCWEKFEAQDAAYHRQVLGDAPRIAIEAAGRLGWDRWMGPDSAFVGMTGFGASAPAGDLYRHFGITADHVVAESPGSSPPGLPANRPADARTGNPNRPHRQIIREA